MVIKIMVWEAVVPCVVSSLLTVILTIVLIPGTVVWCRTRSCLTSASTWWRHLLVVQNGWGLCSRKWLIYSRADVNKLNNYVLDTVATFTFNRIEATVQNLLEQLITLSTQCWNDIPCHNSGKQCHLARNCRMRHPPMSICFRWGKRGHLASNCWDQGNNPRSILTGSAPWCTWMQHIPTITDTHNCTTATCITVRINNTNALRVRCFLFCG